MERSRENSRSRLDSEDEGDAVASLGSSPGASPAPSAAEELCFSIRKHLGGRTGWKIMPETASATSMKPDALMRVVGMIKDMELNGHAIPERITIRV